VCSVDPSAALTISDIPFDGPVGAVRVGLINGEFILNPTYKQREESALDLVVVGHKDGIVMIEGESNETPEAQVIEALRYAAGQLEPIRKIQNEFCKRAGKEKAKAELFNPHPGLKGKIVELLGGGLTKAYRIADKEERETALNALFDKISGDLAVFEAYKVNDKDVSRDQLKMIFDEIEYEEVRRLIFEEKKRADGRGLKDIRQITSEIDVLPRTHGSSLFTRGQTQSLAVVTLGTRRDEQLVEALDGVFYNNFMLHYNFPSFSVGETKPMRGPGRREIGHGALAAKSLKAVMPKKEDFPYTVRVVSEILESNGSSSMASVCAGCLSLMAAGVPISAPVAGISIGLISDKKSNKYCLLTDIMGLEDHFGDMDFKIAGTRKGITAIQLDLKIQGVSVDLLAQGVDQAREARLSILDNMTKVIAQPKPETSSFAPRIVITQVPVAKIGEVIGPGGKMIKKIMEQTGATSIDIDDEGQVLIAAADQESAQKALEYIDGLMQEPEVGKTYDAVVMKVTNFGAFCEFLPGKQGLVHVSEYSNEYVKDMESVCKVGDRFKVKLVEIDKMKRLNLSRKQADS